VRKIIDGSPGMAGEVRGGANGNNNGVRNLQKNIPAHIGAAAVNKASRHYESCFSHDVSLCMRSFF
jgi:hypothetical protein